MATSFLGVNLVTPRGVVAHTETDSVQAPGELADHPGECTSGLLVEDPRHGEAGDRREGRRAHDS